MTVHDRILGSGPKLEPQGHVDDLEAVRADAFAMIGRGVSDRRHAFHTPVLVSYGVDGFPAARTVVLRGFDADARTLVFHTDVRSRKVAELQSDPRVAVVFYDDRQKTQVRALGSAVVHIGDAIANASWQRVSAFSRRCYLGMAPGTPGSEPASGLPSGLEGRAPTAAESEAGFANFAVIRASVRRLDWLYLSARGHRRAEFTWFQTGNQDAKWLTP